MKKTATQLINMQMVYFYLMHDSTKYFSLMYGGIQSVPLCPLFSDEN